MAVSLSTVTANNGGGTAIAGGLQAQDKSGTGTGPFTLAHVLIDGVAGTNMAQITAANALKVDGSAVTQPVSGTFWQATQPVSGTFWQTTQPVSIGTNGTVNPQTPANWGIGTSTQNSASVANGHLVLGQFNTTPTTITTGNMSPFQLDSAGNLLVNIKAGAGSGGTALADEATFTEGTTSFTPIGGVYKSSQTALTSGQAGAVALSAAREMNTLSKVWDGTSTLALMAASSGPPAATVVAVPVTLRDVLPAGQSAMATSSPVTLANNQQTISVGFDTTQLFDGATGTGVTPVKTKVNVSSATTTTVVALTASKKTRVLAAYLVAAGAQTINWQSHTTTSNADGPQAFAANGGLVLPFNPLGWFDTTSGEALDLVTSTGAQLGGLIVTAAV